MHILRISPPKYISTVSIAKMKSQGTGLKSRCTAHQPPSWIRDLVSWQKRDQDAKKCDGY